MRADIGLPEDFGVSTSGTGPASAEPVAGNPATVSLRERITMLAAAETMVVAVVAYATSAIYGWSVLGQWPPERPYALAALGIAVLVLAMSLGLRHFATIQTSSRRHLMWDGLCAVVCAFSAFLSLLFILRASEWYSRGTFFSQVWAVVAAVLIMRVLGHGALRREIAAGRVEARRAILIGDEVHRQAAARRLREAGIHTVAVYPLVRDEPAGSEGETARLRSIAEASRQLRPHDVVMLATSDDLPRLRKTANVFADLPVALHLVLAGNSGLLENSRPADLGNMATIQLLRPPLSVVNLALKRAFDVAASGLGLLLLSPLLAFVALCIKLDSRGPVFFRQVRHGFNNEPIRVFKFRSMSVTEESGAFTQAVKNDKRVTRVGRILRRTNIDELPQLINICIGDMSVVGPRPHPIALNKTFEARITPFSRRHNVKPGLTGWAQVNGFRGETDTLEKMKGRIDCDIHYIDNWSFMLDMRIIAMTVFSRKAYENAY